jgi:dipeptidyl aminopeptidase/acylaminoacyl peptidase
VILLVVGLAGWMIFIVACVGGPAWSPDGSQILFAYRDVENSRTAVALYDRATGAVSTILTEPTTKEGELALYPKWQNDGTRALVGIYRIIPGGSSYGGCELISIPVKSSLPLQVYNLGFTEGCLFSYPQVNGKVYFAGEDLRWVDLETGEVESQEFKLPAKLSEFNGVALSEHDGQIYYQRKVTRNVSDADKEEEGSEVGQLQLENFTLKPSFTFWARDLAALGVQDAHPILWPHGSGVAMIGVGKDGDSDKILFAEENKGIVRALAPDLGARPYKLGNLIWSADGRTLYASALMTGEQKDALEYWLAEIPPDGGRARLTKIASIRSELNADFETIFRLGMPISMSPDGRWIAATPAVLGKGTLDDHDRALFLIDLRDSARPLQRVPIPRQPAAAVPVPKVQQ